MIVTTVVFSDGYSEHKKFNDWNEWLEATKEANRNVMNDDLVSMMVTQVDDE